MRRSFPRLAGILAVVMMAAACADTPTEPVSVALPGTAPMQDELQGCVVDGVCLLPPIGSGGGGWCDPRTTDCGDGGWDTCITSAPVTDDAGVVYVSSCPGGGTEPGGGGGTGSGTGDGDDGSSGTASLSRDMERDTIPPNNCDDPNNTPWQDLYCRTLEPTPLQVQKLYQALDRIAARGPECAVVVQTGRDLLARGEIRFFVGQPGDAGGYGHPNTGIQLEVGLVTYYDPSDPGSLFEHHLVHEIDHVLRLGHVDPANLETPHTAACG